MTFLDNLEQAQETKYSQELTHKFKVYARRNFMMGMWLGEKMNLQSDELHLYAQSVIEADFKKSGHEDVIEKLLDDIKKNNLSISEDQIRRKMDYYLEKAEEELKNK
jgi:hypothetical protein